MLFNLILKWSLNTHHSRLMHCVYLPSFYSIFNDNLHTLLKIALFLANLHVKIYFGIQKNNNFLYDITVMTFIVLFRFYYLIRLFFKNFWTVACVTFGVLLSCVIVFYNGNWSKQCWLIEDRLSIMRKSDLLQTFHRMLKENKFCDTTVLFIQYFTL